MRQNNFEGTIFALTMRDEEFKALGEAGASAVCLPITQAGRKLAELSLSDDVNPDNMIFSPELSN